MTYGPFRSGCGTQQRQRFLVELRALVRVLAGRSAEDVTSRLTAAIEHPDDPTLLASAQRAIDALPSRPRRRILSTFASLRRLEVSDG